MYPESCLAKFGMEGEQLVKSQGEESVETEKNFHITYPKKPKYRVILGNTQMVNWNYHYILLCAKQWLTKKQKL